MAYDKVVDSARLDGALTATADAIRDKTGGVDNIQWDADTGFAAAVDAITTGGGDAADIAAAIVDRTITEYSNPNLTVVGNYAFYVCRQLTYVYLPAVKEIKEHALRYCAMAEADFPELEILGQQAFNTCSNLTRINMPKVKKLEMFTFVACSALENVVFQAVEEIQNGCFNSCTNLKKADFHSLKAISMADCFNNDTNLTAVIIRSNSMATLGVATQFVNTPIARGTGYIYVPAALVEQYKTATNWATFADQFRALEDYTADGTIMGELDETKIAG